MRSRSNVVNDYLEQKIFGQMHVARSAATLQSRLLKIMEAMESRSWRSNVSVRRD